MGKTSVTTELKSSIAASSLSEPSKRDELYKTTDDDEGSMNVAQYLLDMHDSKMTFDFCGGMMFQLVLTESLKSHLQAVSSSKKDQEQPHIFEATKSRMFQIPDYDKSATADNVRLFHGREIRKVPDAAGGMGFVLELSLANGNDPQGWTKEEIAGYDGWAHDVGRQWRTGAQYEEEGNGGFRERYGPQSFGLHHRFYLHMDNRNRMWLSAEDGCEGTPSSSGPDLMTNLSKMFGL